MRRRLASLFERLVRESADPARIAAELFERLTLDQQAALLAERLEGLAGQEAQGLEQGLRAALKADGPPEGAEAPWEDLLAGLLSVCVLLGRFGHWEQALRHFDLLLEHLRSRISADGPVALRLRPRIEDWLACYLGGLVAVGGWATAADKAVRYADLGGLDLVERLLEPTPELLERLEDRIGNPQVSPAHQERFLRLAESLARRLDAATRRAFLERHLERFPRLLEELIALARERNDWPALLDLARRGLTLREDRVRYNQLASEALERLGRPLP